MTLPYVKTSDEHTLPWDRNAIISELMKDVDFARHFYPAINFTLEDAKNVAKRAEHQVIKLGEDPISSDTIRGIVTSILVKDGQCELAKAASRVGMPAREFYDVIKGGSDYDNANLTPSPETSHKIVADKTSKNWYNRMLPKELIEKHLSGDLHIHDEEYFGTRPFCKSWDLRYTFYYGFKPDGTGLQAVAAGPAQHATVAILQATKVMGMGQTQNSGGQGLLHGTVFLAPYMEGKSYEEIHQLCQMMVYELNQMYVSRGGQPCFSSINLNPGVPKILENAPIVFKGKVWDGTHGTSRRTYSEFEREVRLMFKAFMELSLKGDYHGRLFPFPKVEVAIEKKFVDEETWSIPLIDSEMTKTAPSYRELYEMAFEVVSKYGTLYFDNMLPEYRKAEESVACMQCCSFSFSTSRDEDSLFEDRLNFRNGEHFDLGGMQAISINLPRHAYKSDHNDEQLIRNILKTMDIATEIFKIKRQMIINNSDRLQFLTQTPIDPNTGKLGSKYVDFDNLVYEIGIVGLNEMVQYHVGKELHESRDAVELGKKVLQAMSIYCKTLSKEHGMKIVLARTPAETVSQRFAVSDMFHTVYDKMATNIVKGDYVTAIGNAHSTRNLPVFYSNGFAPSVGADISLFERLALENEFWPLIDGGAITHIWLGEESPNPVGLMDFAMNVFKHTNIGYVAFTKDMTQCSNCKKMLNGIHTHCESCGSNDLVIYSRITGYYSVVGTVKDGVVHDKWNAGKMAELKSRKRVNL